MKRVFLIGGYDPSGGAGIIADIKAVQKTGAHGYGLITALTEQNTRKMTGYISTNTELLEKQASLLLQEGLPDAVKIGMIASEEQVDWIQSFLQKIKGVPVVLDPVMKTSSQFDIHSQTTDKFFEPLYPYLTLITPNLFEIGELTKAQVNNLDSALTAGERLLEKRIKNVLVKGGHLENEPHDYLINNQRVIRFQGVRVPDTDPRGTGCSLASLIAAHLSIGNDLESAIKNSKQQLYKAIVHSTGTESSKPLLNWHYD